MGKIAIVINGKAGVGKDTLCDFVINNYYATKVSSITPIVKIAKDNGWDGIKDNKSRRFLSELKRVFSEYNNLPNMYLLGEIEDFLRSDNDIIFAQIREKDQIDDFIDRIKGMCACCTLLIKTSDINFNENMIGNDSDDSTHGYSYDYVYCNDKPLVCAEQDFISYFGELLANEGVNPRKRITKEC